MADFRDELRTAAQKEYYIRTYLGISAPKKSQEYRSAARRLQLIVEKNQTPRKKEYVRLANVAQFNAESKTPRAATPTEREYGDDNAALDESEEEEIAEEGDVLYGDMEWRISKDRIRRRSSVIVTADSAGLSLAAAFEREYWLGDLSMVSDPKVITISRR